MNLFFTKILTVTVGTFLISATISLAQNKVITGRVTSAISNSTLPGVTVTVKGRPISAATSSDGTYRLTVPSATGTLVFSFVGFKTEEARIPPSNELNIVLQEGTVSMEEVVVTGLVSSIKRSNAANSIVRLSAEDLVGSTKPVTLDAALNGKIAGANIYQNSGAPGGGVSVKLRGVSSINGASEPLYVVDGVFVNNSQLPTGAGASQFTGAGSGQDQVPNRISDLNPEDLESVEVLKGPSAAAIYGTRANAGVIIIKTKRGKAGKTQVRLNQDVGLVRVIRLLGSSNWSLDPLGPQGQTKFDYVFGNGTKGSGNPAEIALWQKATAEGKIYNYEKEIYGNTGTISNSQLSISGGNEKTKFYLAGGLNDETGIQKRTGFQRRSIRINLDHKLNDWIDISASSNYINSGAQRSFSGNDNRGVAIGYTLAFIPNYAELHPVNGVYPTSRYSGDNPLAIASRTTNDEGTNRFIQSFNTNINFLKKENSALKLALSGGVDYLNTEAQVYFPEDLQSQIALANPGAARFSKNRSLNTNLQAFLIYNWKLWSKINLTSQVGYVRLSTDNDLSWIQGEGLLPKQNNPNTGSLRTSNETFQRWQDVGLVAQQEANYDDKIIGTFGMRFDKSSLNGNSDKYYPFPRASLAANVANFDFWKVSAVNQLKLRVAYGRTGGQPVFGNTFTALSASNIDGNLGATTPSSIGNPNIAPETAREIETGFDLGFFGNRLSLEASFYDKKVFNLINAFPLSSGTGVTQFNAYPIGDLRNRGVEIGITAGVFQRSNFFWTTSIQYWSNRSKITRLEIPNTIVGPGFAWGRNQIRLGESPTRWYGTPNVIDENGVVQSTRYGDGQPKYQLSLTNQFQVFKSFEFSFLLHSVQGNYNGHVTWRHKNTGGTSVDWSEIDNLYGTVGVPNGAAGIAGNPLVTTGDYIQDASYVRLREISLYYTLPKNILNTMPAKVLQSVKVGFSATNLLTFTDYKGYDPEVSNFGNQSVGANIDNSPFPNSKRLFFHLNVGL